MQSHELGLRGKQVISRLINLAVVRFEYVNNVPIIEQNNRANCLHYSPVMLRSKDFLDFFLELNCFREKFTAAHIF